MSIEQALADNTAALQRMTDALKSIAMSYPKTEEGETLANTAREALKPPKAEKKADAPKAEAIDYEKQLKPAVLAYAAKHGREALMAKLKPFGVTTAKDLKTPEQYAELFKALSEA